MRASRTTKKSGCAYGKMVSFELIKRKGDIALGGGEAAEIYATQISRNLARIKAQIGMVRKEIGMLRKECETAARLQQDIE